MNIESFREYCLSLPETTEDVTFGDSVLVFRLKGKIFACVGLDNPELVTMKCDPQRAIDLREHYSAIEGAFHWNKKFWNQVRLNGDVDDGFLRQLIDHAWDEVNSKLPKKDRVVRG